MNTFCARAFRLSSSHLGCRFHLCKLSAAKVSSDDVIFDNKISLCTHSGRLDVKTDNKMIWADICRMRGKNQYVGPIFFFPPHGILLRKKKSTVIRNGAASQFFLEYKCKVWSGWAGCVLFMQKSRGTGSVTERRPCQRTANCAKSTKTVAHVFREGQIKFTFKSFTFILKVDFVRSAEPLVARQTFQGNSHDHQTREWDRWTNAFSFLI